MGHPIEGQVLLMAGARASVPVQRLPELVEQAQAHVRERRDRYERTRERIAGHEANYFPVPDDHWAEVGDDLGFEGREADAVRRAHETQFQRDGRRLDREDEFERTLEIRTVVAVYGLQ